MNKKEYISSRERVQTVIEKGAADRIPKGELCINDEIVCRVIGCKQPGFAEKFAAVQSLTLDLISLSPDYPCGLNRLPDHSECLWPDLKKWVTQTSLFTFAILDGAFEWGVRILGFQEFCVMLKRSPLSLQELVSRVEKLNLAMVERLAAEGVNGIIMADDIAHQNGLFASPQILRSSFIPSLARQVDFAMSAGLPVFYHSDGNYRAVIEDIVNAGFRGIQCLEKSAGMDISELQRKFGQKICLWGHLDVSDITEVNSEQSRLKLVESVRRLASRGSLILGTTSGLFEGMDISVLSSVYKAL